MYEEIKNTLLKKVEAFVGSIFSEIKKYESELESLKKDRDNLVSEMTVLKTENIKVKEDTLKRIREAEGKKAELEAFISSQMLPLKGMEKSKVVLEQKIKELNISLDKKKQELGELQDSLKSLESLKLVKENFEKEILKLDKQLTEKGEKQKEEETEMKVSLKEMLKKRDEAQAEYEQLEKENKAFVANLYERGSELDKREERLKQKEEGLKIVEQRYKKLYQEKGANFKV